MRVVIQRVEKSNVLINDEINRSIKNGLLVFLGIHKQDTIDDIKYLVKKISNLRIFEKDKKMNLSVKDINGEIMLISNFTLYANTKDGNRPSFENSMSYEDANKMYELFVDNLKETKIPIITGEFGADMKVSLVNDGPITIIIDTKENKNER